MTARQRDTSVRRPPPSSSVIASLTPQVDRIMTMTSMPALNLLLTFLTVSSTSCVAAFVPSSRPIHNAQQRIRQRGQTATSGSSSTSLNAIWVDLVDEYQYLSQSFPLATNSATFGTFAGVGDALAQANDGSKAAGGGGEQKKSQKEVPTSSRVQGYDPSRTTSFVLKGLGAGLIWSVWYTTADVWSADITASVLTKWAIADEGNAHTVVKTISSILLEQFIACPIVYSLWDIPVPALLAGEPVASIPGRVRDRVPKLLLDNAKVWTAANVFIYNIPVEYRVFAVSVCEIFWATIVSKSVASKKEDMDAAATTVDEAAGEERMDGIMNIISDDKRAKVEQVVSSTGFPSSDDKSDS